MQTNSAFLSGIVLAVLVCSANSAFLSAIVLVATMLLFEMLLGPIQARIDLLRVVLLFGVCSVTMQLTNACACTLTGQVPDGRKHRDSRHGFSFPC